MQTTRLLVRIPSSPTSGRPHTLRHLRNTFNRFGGTYSFVDRAQIAYPPILPEDTCAPTSRRASCRPSAFPALNSANQEIIQLLSAAAKFRLEPARELPTTGPRFRWVLRILILRTNGRVWSARPLKLQFVYDFNLAQPFVEPSPLRVYFPRQLQSNLLVQLPEFVCSHRVQVIFFHADT